jgi:hypothetical protein
MNAKDIILAFKWIRWYLYNTPVDTIWRLVYERPLNIVNNTYDSAKYQTFINNNASWFMELDDDNQLKIAQAALEKYGDKE